MSRRWAKPILFKFTRVVDTNTQIPGGTGNFISFNDPFTTTSLDGRPASSIEKGIVVFSGSGAFGQVGIYAATVRGSKLCTKSAIRNLIHSSKRTFWAHSNRFSRPDNSILSKKSIANKRFKCKARGAIITIADTNTPLPDKRRGNFRLFGTPSLSQGNVVFPGSGVIRPVPQGAYFSPLGGGIATVVDRNTQVPGGIGVFRGIGNVSSDDGKVAFVHSSVGKDRLFVAEKDQITLLADTTFNGLSFNDGIVAFIAQQNAIFAAPVGSQPILVVDSIPGGESISTGFSPSIDNGTIAFLAYSGNYAGIFSATLSGSITPVALVGTPLPSGSGNFTNFDSDSPSHRDGIVAFHGFGPSGQEGSSRPVPLNEICSIHLLILLLVRLTARGYYMIANSFAVYH